jgi:ABC-type transport system involved in multi-copper enzyme maturation permease subunit
VISWPVARATAREKLRSPAILVVGACFIASAALGGRAGGVAETFGGFGVAFLLVLTLALGAGLLSDELDSGHAQLVLLRPITRAAWLGGRLAGAGAALAAFTAGAWAIAAVASLGGGHRIPLSAVAVLPLAVLWAFAWLSVLTALGVLLPGWTNAGALVVAAIAWATLRTSVPALLGRPDWAAAAAEMSNYLGPQDPLGLAVDRRALGPALYDVCWVFFAWLVAALLFNRRELARRRT